MGVAESDWVFASVQKAGELSFANNDLLFQLNKTSIKTLIQRIVRVLQSCMQGGP